MTSPLRLFWWVEKPNFGDRISKDIVAHVSGREVVWGTPRACDLFAVGSILLFARRAFSTPRPGRRPVIWGSGLARPIRTDFVRNVDFAAVRGPLTATLLELPGMPFGDPGLLVSELVPKPRERHDRIGLVLHHSKRLDTKIGARLVADGRFELIDVADADHMRTVERIAQCRHVVSSSLHGLVVADAFGVPNTWLDPSGIHEVARLKFYDYALGIGRILPEPITLDTVFALADALPRRPVSLPYQTGIDNSRHALRESFPAALAARVEAVP